MRPYYANYSNRYNMKKVIKTTLLEHYTAPVCEFEDLESEGILCASGEGTIDDWEEDDDPITI